jgi:hypothetical protein
MRQEFIMPEMMMCKRTLQTLEAYAMWMSSGGTESSQHFDTHDNLMIQVQGSKTLLLNSPEHSSYLYMDYHDKFGLSPINVKKVDLTRYPRARDTPIQIAEIHPGDILFIPTTWWHIVRSGFRMADSEHVEPKANIAVSLTFYHDEETVDPSLKRVSKVHATGSFAQHMAEWSVKQSNKKDADDLTPDELCGGVLPSSHSGVIGFPSTDALWWIGGYHNGGLHVDTVNEFFEGWVKPRADAVKLVGGPNLVKTVAPFLFLWVFAAEKAAYKLDLKGEWPTMERLTMSETKTF